MWGSRLRARSASDIFDPSTFFCSSNQTQDGWSSNGPTLHLLSFSVCLPSTLHSRTATTICRLRDDGTSSSCFFFLWELLNISSHGNLSESDCTFCFFFSASWESARGRAGGQGEGTASRGRAEGRRKNSAQRRCRERWKEGIKKQKEKCSQFPSCSFTTLPPFCPDRLVARYACWGPILFSAGSQCWFCLIGWFATSLLIDNHRREILISPSAE